MEWIIKILNEKHLRIVVRFVPLENTIYLIGQLSINNIWNDMYIEKHSMNLNLNKLEDHLLLVYKELIEKSRIYNLLTEKFKIVKLIGIDTQTNVSEKDYIVDNI